MKILKKSAAFFCSAALLVSSVLPFSLSAKASGDSVSLRIEGRTANIINEELSFTPSDTLYTLFEKALNSKGIAFVADDGGYGHYITKIKGENAVYPEWWHIYVNGEAAQIGIDSVIPQNGDDFVIYIGDDDIIKFPTFTLSPKEPKAGDAVTVNVSAKFTDYSDYSNPKDKKVPISGVTIMLDGKNYITDKNGDAVITFPSGGSFDLSASKEEKDSSYLIVRTPKINLTVKSAAQTSQVSGSFSGKNLDTLINGAADKLSANKEFFDWNIPFSLSAAGKTPDKTYASLVKKTLDNAGAVYPTNVAGFVMGLHSSGADPTDFNGRNLISELYNNDNLGLTGLNGYTYSLLALDCGDYAIPADAKNSRESIIEKILSYQRADGAFSLDKQSGADCDMTAIALTALSKYKSNAKVTAAIDKGINFLSKAQKNDGGFTPSYSKDEVCETISQVIIALSSVGIDPVSDTRFIKNSKYPLDALIAFKKADGSFSHLVGSVSDNMASAQALEALCAYKAFIISGKNIFDLTAVKTTVFKPLDNPKTKDGGVIPAAFAVIISAAALTVLKKTGRR